MSDRPTTIFISYARNKSDTIFVDRLEADLRLQGLRTWVDRRELEGGQDWLDEIEKAIDSCQVLLVVLSDEAIDSHYVKMEYLYALNATSGAKQWSFSTGAGIFSSPVVANGILYFGSDDGNLYALDARSGTKKWLYSTTAQIVST